MMRRIVLGSIVSATLFGSAAASGAQSLAEVARKEAERRGTVPTAGKTYTNDNLTPDFTKPAPPPPPAEHASPTSADAEPGTDAAKVDEAAREAEEAAKWGITPRDQQEPGPADDKNEEYWRSRATLIRARLANQNAQIDQLRVRLASMPPAGDPEREVIERSFAKAQSDLKHINDEWLRFERQARDRQIPQHWIR